MRTLGICIGASTISVVELESYKQTNPVDIRPPKIVSYSLYAHEGELRNKLLTAIDNVKMDKISRVAVTGRKFRECIKLTSIPEPQAVETAVKFAKSSGNGVSAVISAGGETFMAYMLNKNGQVSTVSTGNKCASGTGEFFLQQLGRIDMTIDEIKSVSDNSEPYPVSGRCSVFCKSDCTHAMNKGVGKSSIVSGLCKMMAGKIIELLKGRAPGQIMVVGGASQNNLMVKYLKNEIPDLIVPDEAPYFEAFGAAAWAIDNETLPLPPVEFIFNTNRNSFARLSSLSQSSKLVDFKDMNIGSIRPGDECILGLDVGSTTTKAVLLRVDDNKILSSTYLRTNGDPVGASKNCYSEIFKHIQKKGINSGDIHISGIGTTGSGRQIASLHAFTDGVINEIIAHATAATYFDPDVDTIFEIGGQDAKYTYIVNAVPSDYAMNEACSAGTGSFLEEAAYETLNVNMEDIADIAIQADSPLNFNDQCAAFISSDIKNAAHEGAHRDEIVSGLVYSICMNYLNRVKGNRPVGEKVFMQGGVCYNKAVPLAMASLLGKSLVVPPEPGLMGAFGVALEMKKRFETGLLKKETFHLEELIRRDVSYGKSFVCKGGTEKCDRKCEISSIELDGKTFPFGGACNRYYNLRRKIKLNTYSLDFVARRKQLIFGQYDEDVSKIKLEEVTHQKIIGFNRSFLINTYFPLFYHFFKFLGFRVVLPDAPSQTGIDKKNSSFCFPGELSHGFFHTLITSEKPLDYIFLPHFKAVSTLQQDTCAQLCPFVQGESYYLKSTFREQLNELKKDGTRLIGPLLDLTNGIKYAKKALVQKLTGMGISKSKANEAFRISLKQFYKCHDEMKMIGKGVLEDLEKHPERIGIVIFARSYNGFVDEAHMGIPSKFASRGIIVIPYDFLPYEEEKPKRHMYWGMGQQILKAARFVKNHPQLFGVFISNFSCGPDSFVIGYFRNIMERKPSLTLELDSHSADAGLETRCEAFLDIIAAFRKLSVKNIPAKTALKKSFVPAKVEIRNKKVRFVDSNGGCLPSSDKHVTLLISSVGDLLTPAIAASFSGSGFNAVAHPPADEKILKVGRAHTTCKECLPLIITTGTLMSYIQEQKQKDEKVIFLMPTASGPCRFGQYSIFMEDLVKKHAITDVAFLSPTSENSYAGFSSHLVQRVWWGLTIADTMEDIRSMLLTAALDSKKALRIFSREYNKVLRVIEKGGLKDIENVLLRAALKLREIKLKRPVDEIPLVSLSGEIYVRRESLSRQYLTEWFAQKGIAVACATNEEWIHYSDYLVDHHLVDYKMSGFEKIEFIIKKRFMAKYERKIRNILSLSGLVHKVPFDVRKAVKTARPYISLDLTGEAILTIGCGLSDISSHVCGVISIGPFGCMPNRIAESIMKEAMTSKNKIKSEPDNQMLPGLLEGFDGLPFLAIESDGLPFPQIINTNLEAFCLQAERLHQRMQHVKKASRRSI